MNESERLKEKKEADDRVKARKKELAARPEPAEKVYEITLKLTDEPGLPPPVARTNHVASETSPKTNNAIDLAKSNPEKDPSHSVEAKSAEDSEESIDDKVPSLDIPFEEAKRILIDYIGLVSKQDGWAASADKK
jgi:hypothetical protein